MLESYKQIICMCNTLDMSYISVIEITQGHYERLHMVFDVANWWYVKPQYNVTLLYCRFLIAPKSTLYRGGTVF